MPTYAFNSVEQADVAQIQLSDDVCLRCYVWLATPESSFGTSGGEATIESEIRRVQADGEEITVWRARARAAATAGHYVDHPKVMAVNDSSYGNIFVLHWLEGNIESSPSLYHSYLDPRLADWQWDGVASVATSIAWQYDVHALDEGGQGWVVVHRETGTDFRQYRFLTISGSWAGASWTQPDTLVNEEMGMLAIYANTTDDTVAYAYEREGAAQGQLWCRRRDLGTGNNAADWQAMSAVSPAAWLCGGWRRIQGNRWILVCEIQPQYDDEGSLTPYATDLRAVVWQTQSPTSTPTTTTGAGRAYNLQLLARPFARANGLTTGASRLAYGLVGYTEYVQSDFGNASAFVVQFPSNGSDFDTRIQLSGNANLRLVDTRACGAHPRPAGVGSGTRSINGRRTNHVSMVCPPVQSRSERGFTSEVKAYTVAICVYTSIIAVPNPFTALQSRKDTIIVPEQTSVVSYSIHLEEPWIRHRDARDDGDNPINFKGVYAWHPYNPVPVADMLAIAGGCPQVYNGRAVTEIGWTWPPECIELAGSEDVGTLTPGETYTYTWVYEWTDDVGHVHRSAPATPVDIELSDVQNHNTVQMRVKTNTLSMRFDSEQNHPNALIIPYRADAGSTVFRRVYGNPSGTDRFQDTPHNLPDSSEVVMTDIDGDISLNDLLPWQFIDGQWAPLVPDMPPSASVGFVFRDRLVLIPSEEPNTAWYSLTMRPGPGSSVIKAPEFSATNVYRFDGEAITITAGIAIGDHAIVWSADAIYAFTGEFNDDNGFGASLTLTLIHRGVGCIDQNTVVRTADGVFFQSDRGIEFMSKGWELSNVSIGDAVQDDVELCGNLHSATWMEERQQVRWIGNTGGEDTPVALVYHYVDKVWTKFTLPEGDQTTISDGDSWMSKAVDCGVWRTAGEQLHVVLQQAAIMVERATDETTDYHVDQVRSTTTSNSSSTNSFSTWVIEVAWLSLGGLTGLQRVKKIYMLHDPLTANGPDVQCTMDFNVHTGEYPQSAAGSDTLTRSAAAVGLSDFRPSRQKVSGMRLRFQRAGTFTEVPTWSVLSFALEMGIKPGLMKTDSAQRGV